MLESERQLYEQQIKKFLQRLKGKFYDKESSLKAEYCKYTTETPFGEHFSANYNEIKTGEKWGSNWERAWFHITGKVPDEWQGRIVVARLHVGGEGCIFNAEGIPQQAISCHSIWGDDFRRDRYIITESANGGEVVDLWIDATAAQLFGLKLQEDPVPTDVKRYGHHEAEVQDLTLATFRDDIWHLYLDGMVLENLMHALPVESVQRAKILFALREVADKFVGTESNVAELRKCLESELGKHRNASALTTTAVGHAHIDSAWLWPLSETIKKCARTFSTQIALIKKYPGYVFGASQAQHYQFMKKFYPSIYEDINQCVKEGSWEIQGGMWVEADCNLISGESMVRQFIHGMNFFKDEFGVTVKNLWLPDVFGYSAAMPQILKKCGINVMVTQKISWNQFNKFPHHSFIWRGIDGSEIVAHFPPENNYNSELKPSTLRHAESNFSEKGFLNEFLTLFGIGNGGGGPTEEIIETGLRQQDLEGTPQVVFGHAQNMLDRLVEQREKLPKWVGELYLELHRGTLTTQAYNKKMNRQMELKLRELEILYAAFAPDKYPQAELDTMWKKVLLNQFHDIIPGSSINIVYQDSRRDYQELTSSAGVLYKALTKYLTVHSETSLCFINTLSSPYSRPLALPSDWIGFEVLDEHGNPIETQIVGDQLIVLGDIPGLGVKSIFRGRSMQDKSRQVINVLSDPKVVLENDLIRYEFSKDGTIQRAYDKECQREVLAENQFGNVLKLYEDRPNNWDAWDVDIFYERQLREQAKLVSMQKGCDGPILHILQLKFEIGNSTISQTVALAQNSKRLEFKTNVSWQERHKMLRVAFTVDVQSDLAIYEIQYGTVKRPTHRNTSWDMARFEVVGHRFVDLSDNQYGVALLNDCKYGHKILDNLMEINLLRSPTMPDPEADIGEHEFTYAFLPHNNALNNSDVYLEASQLNQPVSTLAGVDGSMLEFPVKLDSNEVILEVLKKAEKSNDLVLRIYEPRGMHASAHLILSDVQTKVYETDLLENNECLLPVLNGKIHLKLRPFEITTLKIVLRRDD
ncbi:MAG: alpha-mannosidase [Deferribacteres bacterium]|nr:alpha-mannosidase [Deferribacteres bacterium]